MPTHRYCTGGTEEYHAWDSGAGRSEDFPTHKTWDLGGRNGARQLDSFSIPIGFIDIGFFFFLHHNPQNAGHMPFKSVQKARKRKSSSRNAAAHFGQFVKARPIHLSSTSSPDARISNRPSNRPG